MPLSIIDAVTKGISTSISTSIAVIIGVKIAAFLYSPIQPLRVFNIFFHPPFVISRINDLNI